MQNPQPLTNLTKVRKGDTLFYLPYKSSARHGDRLPIYQVTVISAGRKWIRLSNDTCFYSQTGKEAGSNYISGKLFSTKEDCLTWIANRAEMVALKNTISESLNGADLEQLRGAAAILSPNGAGLSPE